MDKKIIASVLTEIAVLLELTGENPFKVKAFDSAARIVEMLPEEISQLVAEGGINQIKGIGPAISREISALVQDGRSPLHQELQSRVPAGLLTLLDVPGLGPKKIHALHNLLGITGICQLETACREDQLTTLPGFGQKSQGNILQAIEFMHGFAGQHRYGDVIQQALALEKALHTSPYAIRTSVAGSLRRCKEVVKDIDLLASSEAPEALIKLFTELPEVASVIAAGKTKASATLTSGINADLRVVTDVEFPYALHHFTGSKEHNTAMRHRAKGFDLKMNEYGLFDTAGKNLPCADEAELFQALGLDYIPPELRENNGEIEAAENHALPLLVERRDLQGILHVHSQYSDGAASIAELAKACQALGWSYLGISDHSRSAAYANGLTVEMVKRQLAEIDEINSRNSDFTIFKGIEADILKDGSLDYPDDILASFDFVIGSVHSGLKMTEDEATKRLLNAIANPFLTILGHPTGRLLLGRQGYPLEMKTVIDAARDHQVAIELNVNPYRMDLDWRWCRYAKSQGVKIPINPDAHRQEELGLALQGVGVARKGWLEKSDVLNTLSAGEIGRYFQAKRQ